MLVNRKLGVYRTMAGRTFTKAEGYSTRSLLHYGWDHLRSAKVLFDKNPACYDSAAYLSHLGIELLLKAVLLDATGGFPDKHDLITLYTAIRKANGPFVLAKKDLKALALVNKVSTIRYPRANGGMSIGDSFWRRVQTLARAVVKALPVTLVQEFRTLDPYAKGGRVLMSKRKSEWELEQDARIAASQTKGDA